MEFLFELTTRLEISYLQATMYYFVYHTGPKPFTDEKSRLY